MILFTAPAPKLTRSISRGRDTLPSMARTAISAIRMPTSRQTVPRPRRHNVRTAQRPGSPSPRSPGLNAVMVQNKPDVRISRTRVSDWLAGPRAAGQRTPQQHLWPNKLLLAHRHRRHGASPATPEPAGLSPLSCRGVSSLYCGYNPVPPSGRYGKSDHRTGPSDHGMAISHSPPAVTLSGHRACVSAGRAGRRFGNRPSAVHGRMDGGVGRSAMTGGATTERLQLHKAPDQLDMSLSMPNCSTRRWLWFRTVRRESRQMPVEFLLACS
jgi:hypothetical protein